MATPENRLFRRGDEGSVSVVHFLTSLIMDELEIEEIGAALARIADDPSCRFLILDFEQVDYFSSMFLAKLLLLRKKMKESGGCLGVARVKMELRQIWKGSPSFEPFRIFDSVEAARAWCASAPST